MNSQQLLYIYFGIGLIFVLYFLFFRSKPKSPTRLSLRAKSPADSPQQPQADLSAVERQEREAKVAQVLTAPSIDTPAIPAPLTQVQKENSIYFVYNGHEWECHDVLGIPRGASLQQAIEKYQYLIKTSDASTFPFFGAAFEAILKRKGAK